MPSVPMKLSHASIFKMERSPFWYAHIKWDGERPRRISLKVRDKQLAQQKLQQIRKDFEEALVNPHARR